MTLDQAKALALQMEGRPLPLAGDDWCVMLPGKDGDVVIYEAPYRWRAYANLASFRRGDPPLVSCHGSGDGPHDLRNGVSVSLSMEGRSP